MYLHNKKILITIGALIEMLELSDKEILEKAYQLVIRDYLKEVADYARLD